MISFNDLKSNSSGIITEKIVDTTVDERGESAAFELLLPDFDRVIYYCAPYTHWPVGACRIHSFVTDDISKLGQGGMFILLKTSQGYLGILPLAFEDYFCWLSSEDGKLVLRAGTLGSESISGEKHLATWAHSDDLYKVFAETFKLAEEYISSFTLREHKNYPELFKYLGWCSWEEYNADISTDLLSGTVDKINSSDIPVRYMLVDDGHQDYSGTEEYFHRSLRSYQPDKEKFPEGYFPLLDKRTDNGIKWFGLWLPFAAGMCGINPDDNSIEGLGEFLIPLKPGGLMPKDSQEAADKFMSALLEGSAKGFDFVKVDFMAFPIAYYAGADNWLNSLEEEGRKPVENPYRSVWRINRALEEQLSARKLELMNCNGHGIYNIFNASDSSSSRCSCDYAKGDMKKAREHLFQSYANIPWLGQFAWGDHDMFHSCDSIARMMAVSKAVSGGPVYLSDPPEGFLKEHIAPLCYEDGLILRPLAPAAPLPDSVFLEYPTAAVEDICCYDNVYPFRVIAPLANDSAVIAVYHLADVENNIKVAVSSDDYRYADAMVQPYPGLRTLPEEGLVLWDWYEKKALTLDADYEFELAPLGDRLLILSPVKHGWSVLGRFDKFLGPAPVDILEIDEDSIQVRTLESGPLAVFLSHGEPVADGLPFEAYGNGLYVADMNIGEENKTILISRH